MLLWLIIKLNAKSCSDTYINDTRELIYLLCKFAIYINMQFKIQMGSMEMLKSSSCFYK